MRLRRRPRAAVAARLAVAALVGAAVPLALPATDAAAATVTCTSDAHVFDVRSNGDLWLYDHTAPTTGAFTWTNIHQIGTGFTGTFLAGAGGDIYRITGDGVLHLYNFANNAWTNTSGTAIGAGWQAFNPSMITVDSAGNIYAVNQTGTLYMFHYNKAIGAWDDPSGTVLDLGWDRYYNIAASGDGVLYAIDKSAALFRYRYDPRSQRWTEYGRQVGTGFFGSLVSPGGDVLYFRPFALTADLLYWYHFNDDTGTWDSDTGRLVAQGFDSTNHPQVTAGTDACAVPAPAPVPTVTPDPAPADAPIVATEDDPGLVRMFYSDPSGHVIGAQSLTGSSFVTASQLGTIVTAAPITAAAGIVAVLDNTGQVWLDGFTPLGGYMKAVHLIQPFFNQIDLVGADGSGTLWERQTFDSTRKLLPWRPIGVTIAPGTPNTDLPDLGLVSTAEGGDEVYGVGNTANGNTQVFDFGGLPPIQGGSISFSAENLEVLGVGREINDFPTVVGYDGTAGQASVRTVSNLPDTWHPLPPLALAAHKRVDVLGEFSSFLAENVIAAQGADGFVHVTNNYSGADATYGPWQQLSTQAAAIPPTLVGGFGTPVTLVFRGTDGQLYRYDAPQNTTQAPLSFTGGPLHLLSP